MKRTLENLTQKRKDKETDFTKSLEDLKTRIETFQEALNPQKLSHLISRLEEIAVTQDTIPATKRKSSFSRTPKTSAEESPHALFTRQILEVLKEIQNKFEESSKQTGEIYHSMTELIQKNAALTDEKDKEWDALSNNHVAMIFKSLEWRVDQLDAQYKESSLLMKRFVTLKEKLNQLIQILDDNKIPSPALVNELRQPLEDWRYTGFENRFRGSEDHIKHLLEKYLPYFKKAGKVLDLGCGRGEFLELLKDKGVEAEGIDINEQMVVICQDKGLDCQTADILEKLAQYDDATLSGIFSSQVIEHLPPAYLKRMIDLAYFKIRPQGSIVLETINPTSVFALVQIYHLDISHQQPIHPQALKFLLESSGFEDVEIQYSAPLEEEMLKTLPGADDLSSLLNQNIDSLNKLLYAPPNYAAIAFKR
ncbi:class I SAM-dependent methyltransferase [Acidobacteriota bacterium]